MYFLLWKKVQNVFKHTGLQNPKCLLLGAVLTFHPMGMHV